jgi:hypothetical protein
MTGRSAGIMIVTPNRRDDMVLSTDTLCPAAHGVQHDDRLRVANKFITGLAR